MARKYADLVRQFGTFVGTGAVSFTSTPTGYRAFSTAGLAVGDTFYYSIVNLDKPSQVETGIGTWNGAGFTRNPAPAAPTNFTSGKKQISLVVGAPFFQAAQALIDNPFSGPQGPAGVSISDTPPVDHTILWLDTSLDPVELKYWNDATSAWESIVTGSPSEPITLIDLTGSFSLPEDAVEGATAGILGNIQNAALSLTDTAGDRVALDEINGLIKRGPTALEYDTAPLLGSGPARGWLFTVRKTLAEATNSPHDTILSLVVTDVSSGAVKPVPNGAAAFKSAGDGTGITVTNPVVGDVLYIDPGPFLNVPTSYDSQVKASGVDVPDEFNVFTDPLEIAFVVTEEFVGQPLSVSCHGINAAGTSLTTTNSTPTNPVINLDMGDAQTLTRTSASGATPYTVSMSAFPPEAEVGWGVQRVISSDNILEPGGDGGFAVEVIEYNESAYIEDAAMLAAPNTLVFPAFDDSGFPQLYEMRRLFFTPESGQTILGPWTNTVSKSDDLTNTIAYDQYILRTTMTGNGFATEIGEIKMMATPGGPDTMNDAGVTLGGTTPAAGYTRAALRDGSPTTYCAWSWDGSIPFPHEVIVDRGGAVDVAVNQFSIQGSGSVTASPRNFQLVGKLAGVETVLLSQVGVIWTIDEVKTFTL